MITGLGVTVLALALQQGSVGGVVRDSVDLEPVAYARVTVFADGAEAREAVSDRYGAFVVGGVRSGSGRIEVAGLGYELWTLDYTVPPPDPLRVLARRSPLELDPVVVEGHGRSGDPLSMSPGTFVIDTAFVRLQPVVLETDVLRAAAVSASASAASDWTSIPRIRGASSGGTPVLLDGVRLFNPFHVGGFLSAFNSEAIKRVTVLTGSGGDAQAIGSLSGAFDIATRDGARDRFRAGGSVGLASIRFAAEGPIGEATSYLVDGRRSYIDLFTAGLARTGLIERGLPYSFGDVHAKLTRDLGGVRRLSLTGYLNGETFDSRPGDATALNEASDRTVRTDWGNGAVVAHYRDRLGPETLIDVTVGHSRFSGDYAVFGWNTAGADTSAVLRAGMREYRAEALVAHHRGSATVETGVQATRFTAEYRGRGRPDGDPMDLFDPLSLDPVQTRIAGYANVRMALATGLSVRTGLRADHFAGTATTLAPFADVTYTGASWKAWTSASRSHQALSSLRNDESIGASLMAFDLLAPAETGPVPRNSELAAGWEGSRGGLRLRLEAYARWLANLRLPLLGPNPFENAVLLDPGSRELASGTVRGIEASWSWVDRGKASVTGSYRWAQASRTIGEDTYTPRFHRDHEAEVAVSLERGASAWSVRLSARSGQPTTPVVALLPFAGYKSPDSDLNVIVDNVLHLSGDYNSARLPSYFRIDVGWRSAKEVSWFGGGTLAPYVSVANLFSLPNVVGVFHDWDDGTTTRFYPPQLPMFPFFGLEFRF